VTSEQLAARVRSGVDALRSGRPADAVAALEPVARDPDFESQPDLADVRARVWSLLAQALHEGGRSREAEPWARKALAVAEGEGDREGVAAVRALHQAIFSAATEAARAERGARDARLLAATPLAEVLATLDPEHAASTLVAKAVADLDDGRPDDAAPVARMALERATEAGDVREQVLALLALARAVPAEASDHLRAAWSVADAAAEFTLVGAVARAAELAGVEVAVLHGPARGDA
jgi:hypothetical protein